MLAIGIVVDDAIVIVENASHHIEGGWNRLVKRPSIAMTTKLTVPYHQHHAGSDRGLPAGVIHSWFDWASLIRCSP